MMQFQICIDSDKDTGNGGSGWVAGCEVGRENERNEFFPIRKKSIMLNFFFQQDTLLKIDLKFLM